MNVNDTSKSDSLVEYVPPSQTHMFQFARKICEQMGIDKDDREIVHGLAEFLSITARIKAKNMSSEDKDEQ